MFGSAFGPFINRRANLQAVGGEDVALLAVRVLNQGDEAGAIGIVFDRIDLRGHAVLVSLEIDNAIQLLVAAATMLGGDDAVMVTAIGADLPPSAPFQARTW